MATYVIGDVQGCYYSLQALLAEIGFSPSKDKIWLAGDLINRGLHSLKVCDYLMSLDNAVVAVLGNHDFTYLAVAAQKQPWRDKYTFGDILEAPHQGKIFDWFCQHPIVYQDHEHVLVHAGLYPLWDIAQAVALGEEVSNALNTPRYRMQLLTDLFGNEPIRWDDALEGTARWRFITNACTRMRYCTKKGDLNLQAKGAVAPQPDGSVPWFDIPNKGRQDHHIYFGHWAALNAQCTALNVHALDTGCVWQRKLTAMRLSDGQRISVSCQAKDKPV